MKFFNQAISLDARSIAAHYGKAKTYAELTNYRAALIEYNIVLTLNDEYIKGYEGRAHVYQCLNKIEAGNNDYQTIKKLKAQR